MTPVRRPADPKRETRSRSDRRRGGVRAHLLSRRLAKTGAPSAQRGQNRNAIPDGACRRQRAPINCRAHQPGRRGGGQPLRKGYGQTEGLAVRGKLSPLLPNSRNGIIYRVRADANSLGGLVMRQSRALGVQKDPRLPLTNCGVTATTVVQREATRLPIEGRPRKNGRGASALTHLSKRECHVQITEYP